nr:hypothetical protein CFP56_28770 [Quercus suber]
MAAVLYSTVWNMLHASCALRLHRDVLHRICSYDLRVAHQIPFARQLLLIRAFTLVLLHLRDVTAVIW